jgi:hypothetical protein
MDASIQPVWFLYMFCKCLWLVQFLNSLGQQGASEEGVVTLQHVRDKKLYIFSPGTEAGMIFEDFCLVCSKLKREVKVSVS